MDRPWLRCLAPVLGIFSGFLLGWIVDALIHPVGIASFAVRMFMLIFGILGWAVATIVEGKQLHCGGTKKIDAATRIKYRWQSAIALFLAVLAPVLLITQVWYLYFPLMFMLVTCFVAEVGWGNAMWILNVRESNGNQEK